MANDALHINMMYLDFASYVPLLDGESAYFFQ